KRFLVVWCIFWMGNGSPKFIGHFSMLVYPNYFFIGLRALYNLGFYIVIKTSYFCQLLSYQKRFFTFLKFNFGLLTISDVLYGSYHFYRVPTFVHYYFSFTMKIGRASCRESAWLWAAAVW